MICKTTVKSLALLAFVFVLTIFMYSLANADSMLETGAIINSKMKSLAAGTETEYRARTSDIKAIRIADSLPTDFVPSEANTVSTADSDNPIYIFFDNENDAGIIYFYTEGKSIKMNPDSGYMFANNAALAGISGLADWDSSKVISLNGMFVNNSSLADISPLANWDTHNVAMLVLTFKNTSSLKDISALADWNT